MFFAISISRGPSDVSVPVVSVVVPDGVTVAVPVAVPLGATLISTT